MPRKERQLDVANTELKRVEEALRIARGQLEVARKHEQDIRAENAKLEDAHLKVQAELHSVKNCLEDTKRFQRVGEAVCILFRAFYEEMYRTRRSPLGW